MRGGTRGGARPPAVGEDIDSHTRRSKRRWWRVKKEKEIKRREERKGKVIAELSRVNCRIFNR